jgi:mandelamide amidase
MGRLHELSAGEAVALMRLGDVTAEDYAAALLERCAAGHALNAFISLSPDEVLAAAREADRRRERGERPGPLHGLPIPVKDSVNTRDYPTTSGTPALRRFRPRDDAPVVHALREAGAIVLGKTNLSEMSLGWSSTNEAFGAVRNPWDRTRIPGGSSGGTAVAVAAAMAPLGVAEDTCGSVRVPAALCGIAGLRPTTGRYSARGVMPLAPLFDTIGPHARTVADLALFDSVVTGDFRPVARPQSRGLRLAVSRAHYFEGLDPEVARVTGEALRMLGDGGFAFVEADVPDLTRLVDAAAFVIIFHDSVPSIRAYLQGYETGVSFEELARMASPAVRENLEARGSPGGRLWVTPEGYAAARDVHRPALQEAFASYFRGTGAAALVHPATLVPATPIGQDQEVEMGGRKVSFRTAMSRNIAPGSCAGLPGLVLCAGLTRHGLPVGLELLAPPGSDRELLALGETLEQILGRPRRPETFS